MNLRYYKITPLIVLILLLSAGIDYAISNLLIPLTENIFNLQNYRAPATTSLIGGVLFIYNGFLWRFPVFNLLLKVPDIAGRYKGKIKYEYNGKMGKKKCVIEVTQTASKIKIHSYFNNDNDEKTSSKSLVEDIKKDEDGFFEIYFFYLNSGSKIDGVLDCHEGANTLRFIPAKNDKSQKLVGHYFTNRQNQTRGEIEVYFESKDLIGEF
jgi:hypothetical protein